MIIYLTKEERSIMSIAISEYVKTLNHDDIDIQIDMLNLNSLKKALEKNIPGIYLDNTIMYQIHIPKALELYYKKMEKKEIKKLLLRYNSENSKWRERYVEETRL